MLKPYLPFIVVGAVLVAVIAYLWRELQKAKKALDAFPPPAAEPSSVSMPDASVPGAKRQRRVRFAVPPEVPEVEADPAARSSGAEDDDLEGLEDAVDPVDPVDAVDADDTSGGARAAAAGPPPRAPR